MTQNLLHNDPMGRHVPDDDREAKWQRHVVVALWIIIAFVITAAIGLSFAASRGLFESQNNTASPAWSVGWP